MWNTEINIHNPGSLPITVKVTLFRLPPDFGHVFCLPQTIGPGATAEFSLHAVCPNIFLVTYGRLELSSLETVQAGESEDPAGRLFLAVARVSRLGGRYFTVEGFPQGNLSGNKSVAAVNGLKSGVLGPYQWRTACYAAALNEPTPVFVTLVDGNGQPIGNFASAALDPVVLGIEGAAFLDVFTAVGAPPGNYANVTARFSTAVQGGQGGAGVFGFCRIINVTLAAEALEVAKYLDNNDDGRQSNTVVTKTRLGEPLGFTSEIDPDDMQGWSNLHVAYFEHPDRIECSVRFLTHPKKLAVFDLGQIRLIDPDDNVVAGGPHAQSFAINLRDKSVHNNGRNGRWLIEVGPDRALKEGGGLKKGGQELTEYELMCSSGNGHNQLDVAGHCLMPCQKAGGKGSELLCTFLTPYPSSSSWPNGCFY